jgi:dihydrodipicolinate synthase/N-acetylneuraminate lyase
VAAGRLEEAWALYRQLLPLLRWDSTPRLVQAIKYGMACAGHPVGPTRSPRLPLAADEAAQVQAAVRQAQGAA